MKQGVKIADIPEDVWEVMVVQSLGQPIGRDHYNRLQETIKNNPDYFPWETLYNSIPKEVHDTYYREMNPDWDKPLDFSKKWEESPPITIVPYKQVTLKDWEDLMDAEIKLQEERHKEMKRTEAIWNKYYNKYRLPFRPQS